MMGNEKWLIAFSEYGKKILPFLISFHNFLTGNIFNHTSLLTSLRNSSRSLLTDWILKQKGKIRKNNISEKIVVKLLWSILTEAEAKTANARLILQSWSPLSCALAKASSCASLAVGIVISFKAMSSWLSTSSFFLACCSSSLSSSSYSQLQYKN